MFVKMYQSMYDGTLARRGPWEALVTFQQMLILCDHHGVVDIHPEVISRRTLIPLEIIEKGLEELSKPDPESRRSDEDGRRIIPIDTNRAWGWKIVNYSHYRQIRDTDERREYQRNYMRQKRAKDKAEAAPNDTESVDVNDIDPAFNEFWAMYPRKTAKAAAVKAWKKIKPQHIPKLMYALLEHKATWLDPKFIPHPATWLNGSRWEDEKLDYGRCRYCAAQAVKMTNNIPHCARADHLDHAIAGRG